MKIHPITLVAAVALSGCGPDGEQHRSEGEHVEQSVAAPDDPAPAAVRTVRIDPAMLRDLRVTTAASEVRSSAETAEVLGELGVNQNAYAEVAAPIAARVLDVSVDVGQRVEAGQPLLTLVSAELGRARADLRSARAHDELARKTLARKSDLAGERLVPARELEEARAAAAAAGAELRAAQAALGAFASGADADGGGRLVLRSPLAGVVIERNAVRGQLADPSRTVFRVGDLSRLWLTAHVFERDAVRVVVGSRARVTLAALPGRSFEAHVALIGREVEASSRTIPVRLELDNPDDLLRPGMTATVHLPLGDDAATVVAVPLASVQRVGDSWCVFVPRGPGSFEIREVGRGRELAGEVEILRGLKSGETVVVDGAFLLKAEADKARGEGGHDHH